MSLPSRAAVFPTAFIILVAAAACGPTSTGNGPDGGGNERCDPGETGACYDGPGGTEGVGPCTGGSRTCDASGTWGRCEGEVVPAGEVCGNGIDDNCSGAVDEVVDLDGDGYSTCDGDCCDDAGDGCTDPQLVNPGAFEVGDNVLDDDCDGMIDEPAITACDNGLASGSAEPLDYAKAMDLCQMATAGSWGVVDAKFVKADGTGAPNANQRAIRTTFGGVAVQGGAAYAVLSTGNAAATGQTNPPFADLQNAPMRGGTSGFPADWLQANGGNMPNAPAAPIRRRARPTIR